MGTAQLIRALRLAVVFLAIPIMLAFPAERCGAQSIGEPVPRVIIALWDSTVDNRWHFTLLHEMAEMPLNFLGLVLEPHDINAPLPDLSNRPDVRGIITWFGDTGVPAPALFLAWAERAVGLHKRYVSLGNLGFTGRLDERPPLPAVNHFLHRIGLHDDGVWVSHLYHPRMPAKDALIGFERPVVPPFPGFEVIHRESAEAVSHLAIDTNDPGQTADLVVTGPNGGYVASDYTHFADDRARTQQWTIDPFAFFRLAFATDDLPKPDVTTIVGRRIYYSQVDGDGGRDISEITPERGAGGVASPRMSVEVLTDRVIKPHPELPVTIAPIAAELDPEWHGTEQTQQAIRAVMALPQVEAGTHTYSHPFNWSFFFPDYNVQKEAPFMPNYEACGHTSQGRVNRQAPQGAEARLDSPGAVLTPRAYACRPFDLDLEISGSVATINRFLPPGKKVEVLQWSGDTRPFAEALRRARIAGLPALNGGDARFDPEFPSVSWVPPVGRWEDGEWQIYASASNENTYTYGWKRRFYGIKYVTRTWENTETPRRLKPMDLYYHFFSGDKEASVDALLDVIDWLRDQDFTPIPTSLYARIADGFYRTQLVALGPHAWRVANRGALQTLRIDDDGRSGVDLIASTGILGWRHYEGSLYVALDPAADEPILAQESQESQDVTGPILRDSRWLVSELKRDLDGLRMRFTTHGFGRGRMHWAMPETCGMWNWLLVDREGGRFDGQVHSNENGEIELNLPPLDGRMADATVACAGEG